jgi:hypothetical protein
MARSGSSRGFPCQILERPSASCWALFIIIIGAIIATLCLLFDYQDRRPYRRIGYCQNEEIATGLGSAVGALAGMFYDAVPKFSYAFIARMTIHYHYETIFPNTPNNKDAGFRAGRAAVTDPGAGSIAFPASWSVSGSVPYHRSRLGDPPAVAAEAAAEFFHPEPVPALVLGAYPAHQTAPRVVVDGAEHGLGHPAPEVVRPAPQGPVQVPDQLINPTFMGCSRS